MRLYRRQWKRLTVLMVMTCALCVMCYLAFTSDVITTGKDDIPAQDIWKTPEDARIPVLSQPPAPVSNKPTSMEIFQQRRKHLEEACKKRRLSSAVKPPDSYGKFRVRSLVYCPLPKTGTTFWKRLLYYLDQGMTGRLMDIDFGDIHRKAKYLAASRSRGLSNYTSVVFVREPFARLFSAYVDKFFKPRKSNWARYGKTALTVASSTSKNTKQPEMCIGSDVTFPEFVRYVITVEKESRSGLRDEHFTPLSNQCGFCKEKYDLIGHQESFAEDTMGVLEHILKSENLGQIQRKLNLSQILTLQDLKRNTELYETDALIRYIFEHEIDSIKPCMARDETLRRLWKTLQIRGMLHAEEFFPLSKQDCKNITKDAFLALATLTYKRSASDISRHSNRFASMHEAYSQISLGERRLLSQLFDEDFKFFGYDPRNPYVFPASDQFVLPYYRYFDVFDSFLFVNGN